MGHMENKLGEFASIFFAVLDAHNNREEDISWLKAKVADLEDGSGCKNKKIRCIPETV